MWILYLLYLFFEKLSACQDLGQKSGQISSTSYTRGLVSGTLGWMDLYIHASMYYFESIQVREKIHNKVELVHLNHVLNTTE